MNLEQYIINHRRHIHKNPETGFDTYKTASYVKDELDRLGYETHFALNNASVIARLNLDKNKTIGFRADMDALKIKEETNLEYASCNNNMHACGHDSHTAILLGAAKLFIENKNQLQNNIVLIFQCAEEGPLPGGAYSLLKEGAIPKLDEIYALHVTNEYEVGQIAIKKGEAFSGADFFEFKIHGKSGHGSKPELANNPNIALAKLILLVNEFIEELRTTTKCAFTICHLDSGFNYNVIPDEAKAIGTIRFFNETIRTKIHNKALEIAKDVEDEYKVKIEFNHLYGYDPLYNNIDITNKVLSLANNSKVLQRGIDLEIPTMVAEDFGYYLNKIPGCMMWLGVHEKDKEVVGLHSSKFTLDEKALEKASRFFLEIALNN